MRAEGDPPLAGGSTVDALLDGRVRLVQPRRGYRAAIDPVLLAAAVAALPGQEVLDVGCGQGAASLSLAARLEGVTIVGLEREPVMAALAREGAALSGLADRVRIEVGDLMAPPETIRGRTFPWVMTNPPYYRAEDGTTSGEAARAVANVEEIALGDWIAACLRRVAPRGRLVVVHRAERLADLLAALDGPAGAITILPVHASTERPARRILVSARKGVRTPMTLLPALTLHRPDGSYTSAADAVLRHAGSLLS
jgi:tRNA1(Val) A37 N6-methylase TrmN6